MNDDIRRILSDIGRAHGLEIELNDQGACELPTADGGAVHLQLRPGAGELDFVSPIGEVPPKAEAAIFRALLAANLYWDETMGATLSYSEALEQVVLAYPLPLAAADAATVESTLLNFLHLRERWMARLAEDVKSALERQTDDEEDEDDDDGLFLLEEDASGKSARPQARIEV